MLNIGLNIKPVLNGLIFSTRKKNNILEKLKRIIFLIRYLNTHYVKKRQTNELDNSYVPSEYTNDNNDPPLVEIGEV